MKRIIKITATILIGLFVLLLVFSISMYFITSGEYAVPNTVTEDTTIPHIEIDKVIFHSETFGSDTNQTVIIIHGGPGNDYKYLLPLKALADKYFVVFYDQRGTGLSPRVDAEEQSLENSLSDLDNIINYYSPHQPVYLIGHSWGAMLASGYIARKPEKVRKVILAEPGMLTSEKAMEYMQKFKVEFNWQVIKAITTIAFESLHVKSDDKQARIDYIFGKIGSLDMVGNPMRKYFCGERVANGYLPYWRLSGVASQSIMKKGMDEKGNIQIDLVSGLENYTNKVLFIAGSCNKVIGKDFQEGHMKYFNHAEMVVINGAGHTMFGEKTEESLSIIKKYFEEE
ncbi:MAG: alpha/beta hydrolase [Bacteroidales bacterium]|jgi:proline iminopeptidase|nr:alpha/beta hydrolase [Bacteroidales bacterium]